MRYSIPSASGTHAHLDVATTNRVLRNTYTLLAITLLPTIAGAFVGALFPLFAVMGWASLIIFLAAMFGLQMVIIKNRNSGAGVAWLLLFTFVMGYFTGPIVGMAVGAYSNGVELVALAIGGTAAIFFGLAGYATVTKRDFSGVSLGKGLFIGLGMLFVISLVNSFLQISAVSLAVSSLVMIVASGYILFTVNRIVRGGEDNYIVATLTLYIMLLNIFQSLLHLLMAFAGERE